MICRVKHSLGTYDLDLSSHLFVEITVRTKSWTSLLLELELKFKP